MLFYNSILDFLPQGVRLLKKEDYSDFSRIAHDKKRF